MDRDGNARLMCCKKAWFPFTGQRWLNQCLQNLIAHLLPTCCLLPLLVEVPARTGDRVPERRRHFLLLFSEVESRGRWGRRDGSTREFNLTLADCRLKIERGVPRARQQTRSRWTAAGWGGGQGGAQIINATGGRIWSGRRRGGAPQEPPSGTPTPF